jgi:hypothetical protein
VNTLFYVARNGEVVGQYSEEEFRARIFSSEVAPDDYYIIEGMKEWVPVSQYRTSHEPSVSPPPLPKVAALNPHSVQLMNYFRRKTLNT